MSDKKNSDEENPSSLDPEKSGITLIKDGSNSSSFERTNWTHEMTELMLSTLADNKEDFMCPNKKKIVFIRVKNKLLQCGHSFTVSDISKKYSNLIQTYRRHKERRSKGEDYKCWIYFDIIDEIIGSRFEDLSTPRKHVSSNLLPEKLKIGLHSGSSSPTSPVPSTSNFEHYGKRKRISKEERESIEERKLILLESLIKARKWETPPPPDEDEIGRKLQKLNSAINKISESAHTLAESASSIAESAQIIAMSVSNINNLFATNRKIFKNNSNIS